MKKSICLSLFALLISFSPCSAQFNIPLQWTGGTGGGNTDLCGTNVLTITADPIPAGLTYKWYSRDFSGSCNTGFSSQPVLIDSGSAVIFLSETQFFRCYAVDSLNQIQGESFEFSVFNTFYNKGICGINAVNDVVEVCNGDSTFLRVSDGAWQDAINLNGSGTIQWQMNGIDIPGANNVTYYATAPGSYRVLFTLSCGTEFSNAIQVNYQPNPPTPVIIGDFDFCQGSSTVLTANGAFSSYLWSTGETTNAITVNSGGSYTVSVSNAAGCTSMATTVVTENPNPVPNITGTNLICQGSTAVLDAGAGFTAYMWSPGAMTQTVNVGLPGPYTVWVTDINGCTGSDTFVLNVNPAPVPQITGNTILCLPQTNTLDAGGGYSLYQWNIGTVTQSITVSSIGTYTVTVTDNNGCTGSDSIQVTGLVVTMNGNATICNGSSTNLVVQFAGIPPFNYSYSEGTTVFGPFVTVSNPALITVSPSVNTTYFLVSAGDANCAGTVTGSATITISAAPVITTGDSTLCQTQTTVLDAGSGWTGYLWSTGATTQAITVSSLNNYTVTVTDASGCTGTDNIYVGPQPPYITALTASGPLGICQGDSVMLMAQTPMVFYLWYKDNIQIPGATSSTYWASGYGKYKCMSLDTSGCTATSNQAKVAIVCFPPPPPIDRTSTATLPELDVILFPNPNNGDFNLRFNREIFEVIAISILDVTGKSLLRKTVETSSEPINLQLQTSGFYFLEVLFPNGYRIRKPVVVY